MNLTLDYVPLEKRTGAVSILYTIGGLVGFFSTIIVKPLVDLIQSNGNSFLFIKHIYAQQVLSVIGAIFAILTIIYINLVVKKLTKAKFL